MQIYRIQALDFEWQETVRADSLDSEWMEVDPKHIPWRMIEDMKPLQGWTLDAINRVLNPRKRNMPFERAEAWHKTRPKSGDIYRVEEHPDTYAEVRQGINGHYHVYVHFGGTNENVTIDIDVMFLQTNMGHRIQQIVRRSQRRGVPVIVEDPDEDDDEPNVWQGLN